MTLFTCPRCKESFEIDSTSLIAECPFCATTFTLPRAQKIDFILKEISLGSSKLKENDFDGAYKNFLSAYEEEQNDEILFYKTLAFFKIYLSKDNDVILFDKNINIKDCISSLKKINSYRDEINVIILTLNEYMNLLKEKKEYDAYIYSSPSTISENYASRLYDSLTKKAFKIFYDKKDCAFVKKEKKNALISYALHHSRKGLLVIEDLKDNLSLIKDNSYQAFTQNINTIICTSFIAEEKISSLPYIRKTIENINLKDIKALRKIIGLIETTKNENKINIDYSLYGDDFTEELYLESLKDFEKNSIIEGETLIQYNGNRPVVIVSKKIKIIGESSFSGNKTLTRVYLHNEIKSIENNAFSNCDNLEFVSTFDSLRKIGNYAFLNDKKLSLKITSPSLNLGTACFNSVKEIEMKENDFTKQIKNYFIEKKNNTLITVSKFKERFVECKGGSVKENNKEGIYETINEDMPKEIKRIGEDAFFMVALPNIYEIPSSCEYVDAYAFNTFYGCFTKLIVSSKTEFNLDTFANKNKYIDKSCRTTVEIKDLGLFGNLKKYKDVFKDATLKKGK